MVRSVALGVCALVGLLGLGEPNRFGQPDGIGERAGTVVGGMVLAILGINDARAAPGGNGGGNGGYQAGCSSQTSSNSPNSAQCNGGGGGGGDADGGGGGGDADADAGGGGDGGGAAAAVASFTLCDNGRGGHSGRRIELFANGTTAITRVRCN